MCSANNTHKPVREPIRVLCVFSTLDRGGAETMCMNLYRHIDRSRVQFDFVKHTPDRGAYEDEIEGLGGRVYEAPRYRMYNQPSYQRWWRRHLKAHPEHQIVHGHFFTISAVYFAVCKKLGRTTVAHSHSCCVSIPKEFREPFPKAPLLYRLIRQINRYSDVRLACSRRAGVDVFGDEQFTVVPNAIEAERFRYNSAVAGEVRRGLSLDDCFVFGTVGRFVPAKNPYGTLEIIEKVLELRPASRFLWVGDGPMKEEVQAKARKLGIEQAIVFTGVRDDVERLLHAMDAFVLPSFYEGLPVTAVEAQAAGVPTFCSDTIAREAGITDFCHFLPLGENDLWASELLNLKAAAGHKDMARAVKEAGYDICDTARWIEEFYLSLAAEPE